MNFWLDDCSAKIYTSEICKNQPSAKINTREIQENVVAIRENKNPRKFIPAKIYTFKVEELRIILQMLDYKFDVICIHLNLKYWKAEKHWLTLTYKVTKPQ